MWRCWYAGVSVEVLVCRIQGAACSVLRSMCSLLCAVSSVQYSVHGVPCAVCILWKGWTSILGFNSTNVCN